MLSEIRLVVVGRVGCAESTTLLLGVLLPLQHTLLLGGLLLPTPQLRAMEGASSVLLLRSKPLL